MDMSEHSRPYDPEQLARLTQHIIENGPVINAPAPPDPTRIHEGGIEPYPTLRDEARTGISGLARVFTREGRAERRDDAADALSEREEIIAHIAERIANPRTTTDPKEKIGWVGVHKRDLGTVPRPDHAGAMGRELFRKTPGTSQPNPNRPVTRGQKSAASRLDKQWEKRNKAANHARWLKGSHGDSLENGRYRLSRSERRLMAKAARQIEKSNGTAAKAEEKFGQIASSADLRGRLARWRRDS
jgi:hypothetical protein